MRHRFSLPLIAALAAPLTLPAQADTSARRDTVARDSAPAAPASMEAAQLVPMDSIVAIVGDQVVLFSNVLEEVNRRRASGLQLPADSAGQIALVREVVNDLVDQELLLQKAKTEQVEVLESDVAGPVDAHVRSVRAQFQSEEEYVNELRRSGLGTPEEFRRAFIERARRDQTQERLFTKLRQEQRLPAVPVSEADVTAAFEKNRASLQRRPATIAFRQIIVPPRPTEAARAAARAKAESLLAEINKGGDFEQIAKRESMDESNRETGGDLGWNRRGTMVAEFDRMMFALPPGRVSPIVETSFGYHIIRVDRVQPAEVKARHILIRPRIDSADVARARIEADSVAVAWRAGASFDSLATRHHDPDEERSIPPFERDKLPPSYAAAFQGMNAGEIAGPFPIDDRKTGTQKFVVAEITSVEEGGEYTFDDFRRIFRRQLQEERSARRFLDSLREQTYVDIRI